MTFSGWTLKLFLWYFPHSSPYPGPFSCNLTLLGNNISNIHFKGDYTDSMTESKPVAKLAGA